MKAAASTPLCTRFQNACDLPQAKAWWKTDERCCSGIHTRPFICGDLTNCVTGRRFPHMYSGICRDFAAPVWIGVGSTKRDHTLTEALCR